MTRQARFEGRAALVTGGTDGMGRVVAQRLLDEGARVVICGRDADRGAQVARELDPDGRRARFMSCDVRDPDQADRFVVQAAEWMGGLDLVFNNAGVTAARARIGESCVDEWQRVLDINLTGLYLCLRSELQLMSRARGGAIVNNSSLAGITAIPGQCAYVASKFGAIGLSQAAALEYAQASENSAAVRVNVIAPGPIQGGMNSAANLAANPEHTQRKIAVTAMRRLGRADEVAATVLWLLSDEASYLTGAVIPVDGGASAGRC